MKTAPLRCFRQKQFADSPAACTPAAFPRHGRPELTCRYCCCRQGQIKGSAAAHQAGAGASHHVLPGICWQGHCRHHRGSLHQKHSSLLWQLEEKLAHHQVQPAQPAGTHNVLRMEPFDLLPGPLCTYINVTFAVALCSSHGLSPESDSVEVKVCPWGQAQRQAYDLATHVSSSC